jgi:hypothetical protein
MTEDGLAGLPDHESEPLRHDLAIVREWSASAAGTVREIAVDRRRFDAGQGHALLVVTVGTDPGWVREQLIPLLDHPDRLRVRATRASDAELQRVLQWVINEHMAATGGSYVTVAGIDERAGVVRVALNRVDAHLAARLQAHESGLIRVDERPALPVAPELPVPDDH